jgi:TolB-like protein/Tfp pilus assembly protein PilF
LDRDTIFISHATPDDNDFVRWLCAQLAGRGFVVWADLLQLKGGTPFWTSIEDVLRKRTVKVIFVVSRRSVDPARSGVRNELSVADGLRRSLRDPEFIVPLRIDDTPFSDLPIQIHQLNALDFSQDWDASLPALLDTLEAAGVPGGGLTASTASAPPSASGAGEKRPPMVVAPADRERPVRGEQKGATAALVVLPFQNLSGDSREDYLADGIVEDLTSALSRFRDFAVVARNSAFVYKGRNVDVREAASALGVTYALQGSVRRGGGRLRISTQLVDGITGSNLWAQHFDGLAEDIFDIQDGIVESVVGIVAPEIVLVEIERARRKGAGNLEAYDLYLQALHATQGMTPASNAAAAKLLEQAIEVDPDYAPALILAAWVIEHRITMGWPGGDGDRARMIDFAERALAASSSDARVMAMGAEVLMAARFYDRALPLARRALEINPNYISVLTFAGIVLMQVGDLQEAEAALQRAIRLSPHDPFGHGPLSALAHVRLMQKDYEGAIAWAERSMAVNRKYGSTHWILIAANVYLGRLDEARRLLAVYRALSPEVTLASIRSGRPNYHPERAAFVLEGLRLAGLPEN